MLPWNPEPARPMKGRYPYLVVQVMHAMYQREEITIHQGEARAHIGFRDTFVHHPNPFNTDGAINSTCKAVLIDATIEAVRRTGFRMCLVWSAGHCTFVERDGSTRETADPPSGGLGTGGVGGTPLPSDIEFDQGK